METEFTALRRQRGIYGEGKGERQSEQEGFNGGLRLRPLGSEMAEEQPHPGQMTTFNAEAQGTLGMVPSDHTLTTLASILLSPAPPLSLAWVLLSLTWFTSAAS